MSSVKYSKYHNIVCVLLVRTTIDTSVLLFDLDAGLFFKMEYFLCNEPGPRITTEDDLGTRENWKRNWNRKKSIIDNDTESKTGSDIGG